jgi:hypothetical protein
MGRPLIGDRAMTPAERQRRHRLGAAKACGPQTTCFRDPSSQVTKPQIRPVEVTKPTPLVRVTFDAKALIG